VKTQRNQGNGTSRTSRQSQETSDSQSTNLGVRSSNLFGRANQFNDLTGISLLPAKRKLPTSYHKKA
jgi:hypothetical protein